MAIFNTNLVQITGLTADSTWRVKPLSGSPWNLPASASGVMLVIRNTDGSTQQYGLRKEGSTDNHSGGIVAKAQYTAFVGLNANREISYKLSSSNIEIYVAGYFEYDAVFYNNGIQQTIVYSGQWNIIDISATVPASAKFAILEIIDISESTNEIGVQPGGGSPRDLRNAIKYHLWAVVSLDASRQYDLYANIGSHQVFLVGYITEGSQKQNSIPDITPTTYDAFEDVDLTSETPPTKASGAIVLLNWYNHVEQSEKRYVIRKDGSTDDWTANTELRGLVYYPVGIASGDIFEIKEDDPSIYQEMWLMGFFSDPLLAAPLDAVTSISANVYATPLMAPFEAITSMDATVHVQNSLVLTMPLPEIEMTGRMETADLVLTMPVPELSIYGFTGVIGSLDLTMPMPTIDIASGGSLELTIPVPTLLMTGFNGVVGQILLQGIISSLEITGYLNEVCALVLTFHPPSLLMSASESEIGSLVLTLKPPKLSMQGSPGFVGSLFLQLSPPSLLMNGFIEARGAFVLTMPVPALSMTGDQFFAARYLKGLVMNMSHFAVTDYIGYDFNSLAYFNGKFLGGSQNGIFAIGGNRDNGTKINTKAKIPVLDAYRDVLKKARDAWLTCRTDGQMMLVVQLGEDDYYDDIFERNGVKSHEDRCKLPKGIKERFLSFEIRNVDGSDFDLNNLRFTTDTVTRRRR